jgi:hypothetical protein
VPSGGQRPGFSFAVADDACHDQVGVVERGAVGVGQGVAELTALVDRLGRLGRHGGGDAAGKGELPEQGLQPFLSPADCRVDLAVGASR